MPANRVPLLDTARRIPERFMPTYLSQSALTAALAAAGIVRSVAGRTGDVALTKSDVGLPNVDDTADTAKPVSTAQQAALNLKAPLASPTFTGAVTVPDASFTIAKTTGLQAALDTKAPLVSPALTGSPTANGAALVTTTATQTLTAKSIDGATNTFTNIPAAALTGTLSTAVLPALVINETFTPATQSAMLALTAQRGDMAIRSDNGRTYVLSSDSPSTLADWKEVLAAGQVQSVNGYTGVVTLGQGDITGLTAALAAKAPLASPTFTGTVSGITKAMVGLGNVPNVDSQDASNLSSGTVPAARLGTGTPNSTTFLRGDGTWAVPGGAGGGDVYLANTQTFTGVNTFSATSVFSAGAKVTGAINFGSTGLGRPAFTTRSAGTKIVLRDTITGSTVDNAIGVTTSGHQWYSVPSSTIEFRWFAATTNIMTLTGGGALTVAGGLTVTAGGLTVTAGTITGNGSGITNLNGSALSSGTVPDARLSANVSLRDVPQGTDTATGNTSRYTKIATVTVVDVQSDIDANWTLIYGDGGAGSAKGYLRVRTNASTTVMPSVSLEVEQSAGSSVFLDPTWIKAVCTQATGAGVIVEFYIYQQSDFLRPGIKFDAVMRSNVGATNGSIVAEANQGWVTTLPTPAVGSVVDGAPSGATVARNIYAGAAALRGDVTMPLNGTVIDVTHSTYAQPTFSTRSAGTRLVLNNGVTGSAGEHAIGVGTNNNTWFSVPLTNPSKWEWYGGTTLAATLTGTGALTLVGGMTATTGTFSGAVSTGALTAKGLTVQDATDPTKHVTLALAGIATATTRTLTVPNASGTLALTSDLTAYAPLASPTFTGTLVVGPAASADLQGTTYLRSTAVVCDVTDSTKRVQFAVSGITTATTRTLTVPNVSGTIALTSDLTGFYASRIPVFVTSPNTVAYQYTKVASISITAQGGEADLALLLVGAAGTDFNRGRVTFGAKQIAAMGSAPVVTLIAEDINNLDPSLVRYVVAQNDGSATVVNLYVQIPFASNNRISGWELGATVGSNSTIAYFSNQSLGASSPGGTTAVPVQGRVPTGGTTGQVLSKNSGSNYDVGWSTPFSQTLADARYAARTGGLKEAVAALSATTGTATGDLSTASIFTVSPTGNITLAFSNVPATGTSCSLRVIVTQGATVRTVTMPSGTKWIGAAAPTQVANKVCIIDLNTVDGGTTWYAGAGVEQ